MKCLNPYSNGLPSRGGKRPSLEWILSVLIPILMDYPLGDTKSHGKVVQDAQVLIPILMDYPLGEKG